MVDIFEAQPGRNLSDVQFRSAEQDLCPFYLLPVIVCNQAHAKLFFLGRLDHGFRDVERLRDLGKAKLALDMLQHVFTDALRQKILAAV